MDPTIVLRHPEHPNTVTVIVHYRFQWQDRELLQHGVQAFRYLRNRQYLEPQETLLYACIKHVTASTRVFVLTESADVPRSSNSLDETLCTNALIRSFVEWNQEQQRAGKFIMALIKTNSDTIQGTIEGLFDIAHYGHYFCSTLSPL